MINNVKVYDLEESIIASGYPMMVDLSNVEKETEDLRHCLSNDLNYATNQHFKRMNKLANTPQGSGHNQALTGILVSFDLTFSNKAWIELERYNFVNFCSSQSSAHRIAQFDLQKQYNEYVDKRIIAIMEELQNTYNTTKDKEDYLRLLYSNPCGFLLTARLTTNYRQLKTIYAQRKNHKLPEWRAFCKWIETLPYAHELIIGDCEAV